MKLLSKKLSLPINASFTIRKDIYPCLDEALHFHEEFELIYIGKGHGVKLVGDHMSSFAEGDMAFLGPNLPHLWRNNVSFYQNNVQEVEACIIHFPESFLGEDFFKKPEMKHIQDLFHKSRSGLGISGKSNKKIAVLIKSIFNAVGFRRILILLDLLDHLAMSADLEDLSTQRYSYNFSNRDSFRMDKVYQYLIDHFKEDINLDEIAAVANLSASAFCRYFKKHTTKPFSLFLNEIKTGYACRLLIEDKLSISQIAYESGFKSLTNFHRQFKAIIRETPHEFRARYL